MKETGFLDLYVNDIPKVNQTSAYCVRCGEELVTILNYQMEVGVSIKPQLLCGLAFNLLLYSLSYLPSTIVQMDFLIDFSSCHADHLLFFQMYKISFMKY